MTRAAVRPPRSVTAEQDLVALERGTPRANDCQRLHRLAMELCDAADALERCGQAGLARGVLQAALWAESTAAALLKERRDLEPSRSVLHRSAAWIAVRVPDYEAAQALAIQGLNGNAPPAMRTELVSVLEYAMRSTTEVGDESAER